MLSDFATTTNGKWILSGEHAVLRGHPAIVFPLRNKTLDFQYTTFANLKRDTKAQSLNISANYFSNYDAKMTEIISQTIDRAFAIAEINKQDVKGYIEINNNIETGLGMGSSAALCVAIAKWFVAANFIKDTHYFAKTLENFFHGQSSGLDIAAVESERGIYFQQGKYQEIKETWQPNWQLSSCGESNITAKCIAKVQDIWQKNPQLAAAIDLKMHESTELAKSALENNNSESFKSLTQSINLANNCFQNWGLITENMQNHMQDLLDKGAKAVKPTGSGGGGLIVSLWE